MRLGHGRLLTLAGALACPAAADAPRPPPSPFAPQPQFLPVDEAFAFTTRLEQGRFVARWEMPPGYYLYSSRFALEGDALGPVEIPPGTPKDDAWLGTTEVHYGSVEIAAPLRGRPAAVTARLTYQGCAEGRLCYPPQQRTVTLRRAPSAAPPQRSAKAQDAGGN